MLKSAGDTETFQSQQIETFPEECKNYIFALRDSRKTVSGRKFFDLPDLPPDSGAFSEKAAYAGGQYMNGVSLSALMEKMKFVSEKQSVFIKGHELLLTAKHESCGGVRKLRRRPVFRRHFHIKRKIFLPLCIGAGLLLLLMGAGISWGEKLYKYKGENGVWHFTNIPPDTSAEVETRQIRVEKPRHRLSVQKRGSKENPEFYAINGYYGPVEIEFRLVEAENIHSEPPLPARFVIPPFGEMKTVDLRPARPRQKWSYRYHYRFVFGDPGAVHRPEGDYLPPFAQEKSFWISQAFHGKYSHYFPGSKYAVDFPMPEGTKICAARGGIIMDISNDFFSGGTDASYSERANLIRILHDDGSMAVYAHLKLESARFPLGKRVSAGEFIAESGNTGFSTGPHLHFVIQKNSGMNLISLPFTFADPSGKAVTPVEGMILKRSG